MAINGKLPRRKHPRLKGYDYSSAGAYFITICTHKRRCLLSKIVGRGLAPAEAELTNCGKIAEQELLLLEQRYPFVKIDKYMIMPNHIHVIIILARESAGASPRPTIMDIVCSFKSLATRASKKADCTGKIFQASFYDHIIRDGNDYDEIVKYIHENPINWYYDELYSEDELL